jgi:hypothetical protein
MLMLTCSVMLPTMSAYTGAPHGVQCRVIAEQPNATRAMKSSIGLRTEERDAASGSVTLRPLLRMNVVGRSAPITWSRGALCSSGAVPRLRAAP